MDTLDIMVKTEKEAQEEHQDLEDTLERMAKMVKTEKEAQEDIQVKEDLKVKEGNQE